MFETARHPSLDQFGLRYLYKHLGIALKDVPFEITNHNKVVAVVTKKIKKNEQKKFN